jgi:CxxC-x17-CxxC domain-containing protein
MNNFKKNGFRPSGGAPGGRPKFGGNKKFGGKFEGGGERGGQHHARPIQLFDAVCAQCGKNCQVPFRPNGEKPVYCRECFGKQPYVPGRNSNGADGPRPDFRAQPHPAFQPGPPRMSDGGVDALKRQLDSLEAKVTRILELMNKKAEAPAAPVVNFVPKAEAPKAVKAKAKKTKKAK